MNVTDGKSPLSFLLCACTTLILLLLVLVPPAHADEVKVGRYTIPDANIQADYADGNFAGVLVVVEQLLTDKPKTGLAVKVVQSETQRRLNVTKIEQLYTNEVQRLWAVHFNITPLGEENSVTRPVLLSSQDSPPELATITTSIPAKVAAGWTFESSATHWYPDNSARISFTVTAGPQDLEPVRLVGSTLIRDDKSAVLTPDQFSLAAASGTDMGVPAHQHKTIYLSVPKDDFYGKFDGQLTFAAGSEGEIKKWALTLEKRAPNGVLIGLAAILVGLLVVYLVQHLIPASISSKQAKKAQLRVVATAQQLRSDIDNVTAATGISLPMCSSRLNTVDRMLDEASNLLPNAVSSGDAAELAKVLKSASTQLAVIRHIHDFGLLWAIAVDAKDRVPQLDQLALNDQAEVEKAVAHMRTQTPQQARTAAGATVAVQQLEALEVELGVLKLTQVLFWLGISALSGWAVLIARDPSFGGAFDYLMCFLWAFGLPFAGNNLDKLNPTAIAKAVKFDIPVAPAVATPTPAGAKPPKSKTDEPEDPPAATPRPPAPEG